MDAKTRSDAPAGMQTRLQAAPGEAHEGQGKDRNTDQ